MSATALVHVRRHDGGVVQVTLHDAARKNALSFDMVEALERVLTAVAHDETAKVVVLAGLDEYFCTGANREVLEALAHGRATPRDLLLPRVVLDVPVPVIAAMSGHAIGGGLALALCADVLVLAREGRYGASFMNFGFTPGMGITRLLEYVVGPALAAEMLLGGQAFPGRHFEGRGVNYVVPRADVLSTALSVAARQAEKPRMSLVALKTTLAGRKRELFEAARTTETLMHQITFPLPEVERLVAELLESE